jgi:hypothetical protein
MLVRTDGQEKLPASINAPAYSTALLQIFFGQTSHQQGVSTQLQPIFGSLRLLRFSSPELKIAVESEEICECDGHTLRKLSQRRLTAD